MCFRQIKMSKLLVTKLTKNHKEKKHYFELNHTKNNIMKITDSSSKVTNINANSSSFSTSSSINRVPQESSQSLTKYSSNTDINCKADSTNIIDIDETQSTSTNFHESVIEEQLIYKYLSNCKKKDPLK